MTRRRQYIKATGIAGLAGLTGLAGCNSGDGGDGGSTTSSSSTSSSSGGGEPVKIGALLPLSGPFAATGQENQRGLKIGAQYLDGQIMGRDFEIVYKDNKSDPNASVQGARELVEQENVDAIIGPASSGNSIAVMEYIAASGKVPLIPTTASSTEARDKCNPYTFFIWPSNRHTVPVGVDFIQKLPNYVDRDIDPSKVHFVSLDYSLGQNNLELTKQAMSDVGGEVTGSTLVPIGESDWSSYISEIANSDADVVTGILTWGAAAKLIPQATSYGLTEDKTMMFNSGKPVGQYAASTMPKDCVGWYGTHFYNPAKESDINTEFQDLYGGLDSNLLPNSVAGGGFEILRSVAAAMEAQNSAAVDDVLNGLSGLSWDSIFGEISYRESDHQSKLDFVGATRVASDGDVPTFKSLEEYPDVIPDATCSV
ncbi:MAG: ABC transporter substrate-binding protein [Halarchaeum sp.]